MQESTMPSPASVIPADFPFESKFVDVLGSKIHYVEQGEGNPILFLHGIPTWSYLWRNIIPALTPYGRCIAPDLIGMGKSDKPDIPYRVFDHIRYFENFIQALGLTNITLVVHGWGSVIGLDYAMRNPTHIKALAFLESHLRLVTHWDEVSLPAQELLAEMKTKGNSYQAIVEENFLLKRAFPACVLRKLSEQELAYYHAPFSTLESRKLLWRCMQDLPLLNGPQDVKELIIRYTERLKKSSHPKLLMYAMPGFITPMSSVDWARRHLTNISFADVGEAFHCPQETNPQGVCEALAGWYRKL
jgi:haloalkane dehalogenase